MARMQKNGLERPAEEMIETSTFIRTPLTGTAADSKRAWLYSGRRMFKTSFLFFSEIISIIEKLLKANWLK